MSPILVRPIREQLEHDRVIRLLQAKYKRKFNVGMNVGSDQGVPVGKGTSAVFPDLVLQASDQGQKLLGVIEVETSESINNLEAMSQWIRFSRLRVPFLLYVPANGLDAARRLCADHRIRIGEIWTYHAVGEQMRFTLVTKAIVLGTKKSKKTATKHPSTSTRSTVTASSSRKRKKATSSAMAQKRK